MTARRRRATAGTAGTAGVLGGLVAVPLFVLVAVSAAAPAHAAPGDTCDASTVSYDPQPPQGLQQLGADQAHTIATGAGVLVAVVDSGVDTGNAHFPAGSVVPGISLVPGQPGDGTTDASGHGTAIAGEIAARPVAGSGVVGLAPAATILPVRVFVTDDGSGSTSGQTSGDASQGPTVETIAAGIRAAAAAGAKIINVSLSTTADTADLAGSVQEATAQGALVVASAGNRNTSTDKTDTPRYPAAYPDVLAVAAVDSAGVVTDDSIHGSYVGVAAPGTEVLTAFRAAGDCVLAADNASTSYATGYVSAAAALVAQAHPDETPAQWRYRLESTALRPVPDARDDDAGWGVIQPYEALTFVFDGSAPGPTNPVLSAPASVAAGTPRVDPASVPVVDHTGRNQTLWLGLGGVVLVLAVALVALLRRDRRPATAPDPVSRPPAGVR